MGNLVAHVANHHRLRVFVHCNDTLKILKQGVPHQKMAPGEMAGHQNVTSRGWRRKNPFGRHMQPQPPKHFRHRPARLAGRVADESERDRIAGTPGNCFQGALNQTVTLVKRPIKIEKKSPYPLTHICNLTVVPRFQNRKTDKFTE
jgi:hypothetical protein